MSCSTRERAVPACVCNNGTGDVLVTGNALQGGVVYETIEWKDITKRLMSSSAR